MLTMPKGTSHFDFQANLELILQDMQRDNVTFEPVFFRTGYLLPEATPEQFKSRQHYIAESCAEMAHLLIHMLLAEIDTIVAAASELWPD